MYNTTPEVTELPAVVSNYLAASDARRDIEAIVECFSQDAEVLDEGNVMNGQDAIRRWRENVETTFEYTATVTSATAIEDADVGQRYDVSMHLEGNFPGGQADLIHTFAVRDGRELMTAALRTRMGSFGAWLHPSYGNDLRAEFAVEAEELGYPVVWLGLGQASVIDLRPVEQILQATSTVIVATAIVNMWTNDADEIASSYRRITSEYGDRFLLGIGIGHPEVVASFQKPYATMVDYLNRLDAGGVPVDRRILAALGPRALRLAADRTLGTHPYLVVPDHTRAARTALGPDVVIAPEQTIVLDDDTQAARGIARAFVADPYLTLSNYTNNWLRHGFDDFDLDADGSDRLIDGLVPHGTAQSVAVRLREHLDAGADHIGVQLLTPNGESPMPGYAALARELLHA